MDIDSIDLGDLPDPNNTVSDSLLNNTELSVTSEDALPVVEGYGSSSFYGDTLADSLKRTKFIKMIVNLVRRCQEYSRYRTFILENLEMDRCSILSGLNPDEVKSAGLEIHHAPLALYDIVELVLGQMIYNEERVTTFSVANKVMGYHWKGYVGLVPLTQTLHEAVHAGQLVVDPRSIYGDWQSLLSENRSGMTEHLADKLRATALSWTNEETKTRNSTTLQISLQRWTPTPLTKELILAGPADLALPSDEGLDDGNS